MNFLELVQELHKLSGASGLPPSSTIGQTGEAERLIRWISNADYNWQTKWLNWNFLFRKTTNSFQVTTGADTLPPADLFTWDKQTFRIRASVSDSWQPLVVRTYAGVKANIGYGADEGLPFQVVVLPDNSLSFDPQPDASYLFRSAYYARPIRLFANEDVSPIPKEYHGTIIMGQALMYYAEYEDAPEQLRMAISLMDFGRTNIESHELPDREAETFEGGRLVIGDSEF